MTPEQFTELSGRAAAWIASYWERLDDLPVSPEAGAGGGPGSVFAALPDRAAERGEGAWDGLFEDLDELVVPNTLHWQSPGFFGYFPCNASGPAIVGEMLAAGLGVQGMLWSTAPASNEIERRLLDQLCHAFGLPEAFLSTSTHASPGGETGGGGCIQPTASDATLASMVAARRRVLRDHPDARDRLAVYASREAHSSVVKAAMIAGLADHAKDRRCVRLIETDAHGAMNAGALDRAVRSDLDAGRIPAFCCATLGTTGTGAFDPLTEIARVLPKEAWLHVDAAWAGSAFVCPDHRGPLAGVERANSVCLNPHKWLLTSFDCDLFWTRDRRTLVDSMSITPEYLRQPSAVSEDGLEMFDYRDWGVPLGRKFRALKLWMVLRWYGLSGLRAHIERHVAQAEMLEGLVRESGSFEVACPRSLSLLCIRHRGGDEATRTVLEWVNRGGRSFLTHTRLPEKDGTGGAFVIRIAIGATLTEDRHVRALWDELCAAPAEGVPT